MLSLQVIDGAHPSQKTIPYSRENLDWCCGDGQSFTTIAGGFAFFPEKKLSLKIVQGLSGMPDVVCFTENQKMTLHMKQMLRRENIVKHARAHYMSIIKGDTSALTNK